MKENLPVLKAVMNRKFFFFFKVVFIVMNKAVGFVNEKDGLAFPEWMSVERERENSERCFEGRK